VRSIESKPLFQYIFLLKVSSGRQFYGRKQDRFDDNWTRLKNMTAFHDCSNNNAKDGSS